jgi:hypothetical protein
MKNLILILCLFSFITKAFSQDSVKVRTEVDTFKQFNYEGQFDYVFSRKEPKKQLFKLGGKIGLFELAYERKITKDVSINFSLNTYFSSGGLITTSRIRDSSSFIYIINNFSFGIEPRWYYTMKRDIKNGLISDNLNGNYIGLRIRTGITKSIYGLEYNNSYTSAELTWGMQRRILRNQYFDFSIGAGINHNSNTFNEFGSNRNPNVGLFNYRFTYGFILDNNLFKNNAPNCEALRCLEEEKSLWKKSINAIGFVDDRGYFVNLGIAYEQKINNSQWSIEAELNPYFGNIKIGSINTKTSGISFQLTPRLYWTLNKRIAKGESANNLSGKYVGLSVNYGQTKTGFSISNNATINGDFVSIFKTLSFIPILGYQKRLLKHLYLDVNAGYGVSRGSFNINNKSYPSIWLATPTAKLTFGVCI